MNANTLARFVLFCAAGLAAATGAEAKGSLSIGLTIVSSCAVSSAHVYRAAASNLGSVANSGATMVAACANDTSYTVSLSSAAPSSELQAGRPTQTSSARTEAGDVIMTLTY